MIVILLLILGVTLLYWKTAKHYAYWTDRNVKQRKPIYFLGDNSNILFGKESIYDAFVKMYNAFPNERYMGIYQMLIPTLVVRDPDLIKQLTVKDFDHFLNHRAFIPEGVDPLWNKNLFSLKDTEWREMRGTLSPSFTSSKMKMIFTLISECANDFINHFLEKGDNHLLEMKDTFTRYTNDVIASVAFGIKCDSIREPDNLFFTMGTKAMKFGPSATIKFFIYTLAPTLSKLLGISFFPKEVTEFFFNVVTQTIQMRESQGIVRPDMLNLLIEARKGKTIYDLETNSSNESALTTSENSNINKEYKAAKHLTDMDIAAQALVFFFGGFESAATLMSFTAYELALNPECQRKLQTEIDETLKECNGQLTYESLLKMKYMDMVLSETLRKWPPNVGSDRVCTKDYTIEPVHSHEQPVHLKTGDLVWIPVCGIHNDPKYYPEPQKFDPMRFGDDNKTNIINPYTFMPFGTGPRNCIGSRFALMETKTILFHMLSKFDLNVCEKTDVPIQLSKITMQLVTKNGVWIALKRR
ncbi:cytochrome P450, partial [Oryctes borbonicus]